MRLCLFSTSSQVKQLRFFEKNRHEAAVLVVTSARAVSGNQAFPPHLTSPLSAAMSADSRASPGQAQGINREISYVSRAATIADPSSIMADAPDILDPEGVKAHPASKRRRVAVACDACRTRKSRCDGSRPQCSLCRDLGFECIYSPPSASVNVIVQKDYLQGLEGRIKKLEETVWTLKDEFVGLSARVGGDEDHSLQLEQQDEEHRPKSTVPMPDLTGTEDSVDAMGAVTFADEEDSGFFGM